jgi:hypothetical protein
LDVIYIASRPKCSGYRTQTKKIVDNLNSLRREASKHFRNEKKKYLKDKMDVLETNSKINNINM